MHAIMNVTGDEDEEPKRRQDGLHHERSGRFGRGGFVILRIMSTKVFIPLRSNALWFSEDEAVRRFEHY